MDENEGGKKGKGGKEGKGGKGGGGGGAKPKLPELLKSDDFTGQYKEGTVVLMPESFQQAYNNAWIVSLMYSNLCSIFTMGIQLQF